MTDEKKCAVLFDIDGTLMRADGVGRDAMAKGLAHAADIDLEAAREIVRGMDFRGCTDALIIEGMSERAGVGVAGKEAALVAAYLEALREGLQANPAQLLPGVHDLVQDLEAGGVHVGLLTGNVREGARTKLSAFHLEHLVERHGGFGDEGRERSAIAKLAVERLAAAGILAKRVVIIGDTQHDVTAARAAGARAVTVATGWTPAEELRAAKPDLHLGDLSETSRLWAFLRSL